MILKLLTMSDIIENNSTFLIQMLDDNGDKLLPSKMDINDIEVVSSTGITALPLESVQYRYFDSAFFLPFPLFDIIDRATTNEEEFAIVINKAHRIKVQYVKPELERQKQKRLNKHKSVRDFKKGMSTSWQ